MTALAMSGEVRNGTIADFDAGRAGEEFRSEVLHAAAIDRADVQFSGVGARRGDDVPYRPKRAIRRASPIRY